jgi:hypothetical protein
MENKNFLKKWSFFRDIRRLEGRFQGAGVYDDGVVKYSVSVYIDGYRELTAMTKVLNKVSWVKANELKIKEFLIEEHFSEYIVEEKIEEYDYTKDEVFEEIAVNSVHVYCEDEEFIFLLTVGFMICLF